MNDWIITTAAGFTAGIAGALGLGGGSVLLLYLTMFAGIAQRQAQGMNLIFFIPCAIIAIIIHSRSRLIVWREVFPCAVVGLFGSLGGYTLSGVLDESILRIIFAVFLLTLGIRELLCRKHS